MLFWLKEVYFETLLHRFYARKCVFLIHWEVCFTPTFYQFKKWGAQFLCFWARKCWFLIHIWCFVLDFEEYRVWFLSVFWLEKGYFWANEGYLSKMLFTTETCNILFFRVLHKMSLVSCRFAMCEHIFKKIIYI